MLRDTMLCRDTLRQVTTDPVSIKNHLLAKQNRSSRQSRRVATSYLYVHYFKNMIQVIYHGKYVNHVLLYLPRKDHVNNQ